MYNYWLSKNEGLKINLTNFGLIPTNSKSQFDVYLEGVGNDAFVSKFKLTLQSSGFPLREQTFIKWIKSRTSESCGDLTYTLAGEYGNALDVMINSCDISYNNNEYTFVINGTLGNYSSTGISDDWLKDNENWVRENYTKDDIDWFKYCGLNISLVE